MPREYFFLREVGRAVINLHTEAAELVPLRLGMNSISTDELGANQRQSGRVRELLGRLSLSETLLLKTVRGIGPSEAGRIDLLNSARDEFGRCAAAPDLDRRWDKP